MDTKQLTYFLEICKKGSISAAAESIFISQQTLSASMAQLEKDLQVKLFVRSSRGVTLTKAGVYLRSQAQNMLNIEKNIMENIGSFSEQIPNVELGCAYGVAGELAEQLLDQTTLMKEGIKLRIVEYADIDCEKAVEKGEVELGLAIGPIDTSIFHAELITSRNYCFVAHKAHPLAEEKSIRIEQLKGENVIMMNKRFKAYHIFRNLCEEHGFTPEYLYEAGEIAPIHNLVLKHYGIGVSADFVADRFISSELRTLYLADDIFRWDVYLIWKRGKSISKAAEKFKEYLRESNGNYH